MGSLMDLVLLFNQFICDATPRQSLSFGKMISTARSPALIDSNISSRVMISYLQLQLSTTANQSSATVTTSVTLSPFRTSNISTVNSVPTSLTRFGNPASASTTNHVSPVYFADPALDNSASLATWDTTTVHLPTVYSATTACSCACPAATTSKYSEVSTLI